MSDLTNFYYFLPTFTCWCLQTIYMFVLQTPWRKMKVESQNTQHLLFPRELKSHVSSMRFGVRRFTKNGKYFYFHHSGYSMCANQAANLKKIKV